MKMSIVNENKENDMKDVFFTRAEVEEAERIHCDNCFEQVVFQLRDKDHEFSMGLSTMLNCIKFAIQNGDLPKLPQSWVSSVEQGYYINLGEDICYYDCSTKVCYVYSIPAETPFEYKGKMIEGVSIGLVVTPYLKNKLMFTREPILETKNGDKRSLSDYYVVSYNGGAKLTIKINPELKEQSSFDSIRSYIGGCYLETTYSDVIVPTEIEDEEFAEILEKYGDKLSREPAFVSVCMFR